LILADEPTGQLDHVTGTAVVRALLEAAGLLGAALVLTTHDPTVAGLLPVRWTMADGRLRQGRAVSSCSA
jgi:putative ABC transport system ATP-binding protein